MEIDLVSGALGAEVKGIDLKDSSVANWYIINNPGSIFNENKTSLFIKLIPNE